MNELFAQVKPNNCSPSSKANDCASLLPQVSADDSAVQGVLFIVFGVFAAVAILVIVISAINFATSEGNPDKISSAKKTIIYALVGLVIALSAEAAVFFLLGNL